MRGTCGSQNVPKNYNWTTKMFKFVSSVYFVLDHFQAIDYLDFISFENLMNLPFDQVKILSTQNSVSRKFDPLKVGSVAAGLLTSPFIFTSQSP